MKSCSSNFCSKENFQSFVVVWLRGQQRGDTTDHVLSKYKNEVKDMKNDL